ncbi:MAG: Alcohol dehydrogenase zinc-binding domain protein [Solirubrobacterales bacterium]|nr:Alcohol dehydrogenase zinc-binding domain protein [Solirubrobacterales bacterium]
MRAAVLREYGATPEVAEFDPPTAGPGQVVVDVAAAGLHHADRLKASGTFYLSRPPLPSVVGGDGVGRLPSGARVFFDAPVPPFGGLAEQTLVDADALIEVPDGVDDVLAAGLANTGIAAWLALSWRADLAQGETVLVLGATGALGSVAVQAAKPLGAGCVVAADLGAALRRSPPRGADAEVALDGDVDDIAAAIADATEGGPDVIIDALWGLPALAAMRAARHGARLVQLGQVAATEVVLPAALPRAKALDIRGFAYVHAPMPIRRRAYRDMLARAAVGDLLVDIERVALVDIAAAWKRQARGAGVKLVVEL